MKQKIEQVDMQPKKPRRAPPPPPGLPPGFRPTSAASAFIRPKKLSTSAPVHVCDLCYGFLVDYLTVVVSTRNLPTGSQGKRIRQAAPHIAYPIGFYFSSLSPIDIYVIENTVKLRFGVQKESIQLRGPILLTAIVNHNERGKDLLTQLRTVLEESTLFDSEVEAEIWIGELMWDLWAHTITIHREHSKQTEPTGCGPPFGFRIHTPTPVNTPPTPSNPQQTPVVAGDSSQKPPPWSPPEGSWKECDLYD